MSTRSLKSVPGEPSCSPRVLACLRCQQRKVKCDRKFPCAHCVRLKVECQPVPSARPRKRRFPERQLLDRLRSYEDLLRQHKIDFEPLHGYPSGDRDNRDQSDDSRSLTTAGMRASSPAPTRSDTYEAKYLLPALSWPANVLSIADFYRNFWHASGHEIQDANQRDVRESVVKNAWDQSFDDENYVLFGARKNAVDVTAIHPEPVHILRLWNTYLRNVDPLIKVTHSPSLEPRVLEAACDVTRVDPVLEALMFSIYSISIFSMPADECQDTFGVPREELLTKYQLGCQQALMNCGFLRTDSRECLTALHLFLISIYPATHPRSLSSMLGIAIRIAQRMGIDNETKNSRCLPFEAEMRRRLWWSLMIFDTRIGDLAEFHCTTLTPTWDCMVPHSSNDSDMRAEMTEAPPEEPVTEALFAVVRCLLGDFLRHAPFYLDYNNPALKPLAKNETDMIIMEKRIEEEYLRFCDPETPLHFLTIWAARGQFSKWHLMRHYSQYSSSAAYQKEDHRNAIILHSLRMLESDTKMMTSPLIRGYLWLIEYYFPLPAYIFLMQELRLRPRHQQFSRAWEVMAENCEARFARPSFFDGPHFTILANVILQAWDTVENAHRDSAEPLTQPRLVKMIEDRMSQTAPPEVDQGAVPPPVPITTGAGMSDFSTSPMGFGSNPMSTGPMPANPMPFGMGVPASTVGPDPSRPFFMPGQPPSMAEVNHMNHMTWASMVWGMHNQGRPW